MVERARGAEGAEARARAGVYARAVLYAVASALFVAALVRFEADPPGSREALDLIHLVDRDGDGLISQAEYDKVSEGELPMSYVDADGDGVLAPWEVDVIIDHISPLRASMSWVPRAL